MTPIPFAGEIAALATALCWAIGPTFFTLAGRRLGSAVLNRARLVMATLMLIVLHRALTGCWTPVAAVPSNWIWLAASGAVGLVIGDSFLFQAFVLIGARLSMLIFSLTPVITALLARLLLGERLGSLQVLGMTLTLGGIAWVLSERGANGKPGDIFHLKGALFALGGAVGQAGGFLLARRGLEGELPAISGHLIRLGSATLLIWILTLASGRAVSTLRRLRSGGTGLAYALGGAVFGPLIGVWLSLIAVRATSLGVASTLMALPPLFLLPLDRIVFGRTIHLRAVLGTLVALGGVALLFLD